MVATQILTRTGIAQTAGKCIAFILSHVFGVNEVLCGAFLTGVLGGFPNGVHATGIVYKEGGCSKSDAEYCIALANNCSVSFVISVAGIQGLGSRYGGLILLLAQLICVLIISVLFRILFNYKTKSATYISSSKTLVNLNKTLCASIFESCKNMINVCGFIMIFYIISKLITMHMSSPITLIINGIFEVSSSVIQVKNVIFPLNFIFCSAIVGFSGLSVLFQVADACEKYGLSPRLFIYTRLVNVVLMPVVTSFLLIYMPCKSIVFTSV